MIDHSTEEIGRERRGSEPLAELLRALEEAARSVAGETSEANLSKLGAAIEALDVHDLKKARGRLRNSLWGRLRAALYKKENATIHRVERSGCATGRMCNRGATWASANAPEPRCKPHLDRRIASLVETSMREAGDAKYGGTPATLASVLAAYEKLGVEAPGLPDWAES